MRKLLNFFVLITFLSILFPRPTYAYIDPGTGSYVFQILIAGFLGVLVSVKMFWKQISLTVRKLLDSLNGKKSQEK